MKNRFPNAVVIIPGQRQICPLNPSNINQVVQPSNRSPSMNFMICAYVYVSINGGNPKCFVCNKNPNLKLDNGMISAHRCSIFASFAKALGPWGISARFRVPGQDLPLGRPDFACSRGNSEQMLIIIDSAESDKH